MTAYAVGCVLVPCSMATLCWWRDRLQQAGVGGPPGPELKAAGFAVGIAGALVVSAMADAAAGIP